MTDRELNITLRESARQAGLCNKWYDMWSDDSTIDECLDRYVIGHDFAIVHDWPSLSFIRGNFRLDDLHRHNIYIDESVDIEDCDNGTYVFLGSCDGHVRVTGFKAVTIYLRHRSSIDIDAEEGARVFVRCYERAQSLCRNDEMSKIFKYQPTSKKSNEKS